MEWMFMPLKRYADFSGRSRRMEFWMWQLAKFGFGLIIWILFIALFGAALSTAAATGDATALAAAGGTLFLFWAILMIVGLGIFIPDLAVTVRRLHDTDRTGWWILAPLVPYLIFWFTLGAAATSGATPDDIMAGGVGVIGLICILVMLLLALTLLVFYFLDGTPGPNRFGPDPKGRGEGQVFS